MDLNGIINTIESNKEKEFVGRILMEDGEYPVLNNPDGSHSTHSMAWDGPDEFGRSYVYPTVVNSGGVLKRLDDRDAYDYAMENGEFIEFDNPSDADTFSKDYKLYWDYRKLNKKRPVANR
jgi:hypothetical protein